MLLAELYHIIKVNAGLNFQIKPWPQMTRDICTLRDGVSQMLEEEARVIIKAITTGNEQRGLH